MYSEEGLEEIIIIRNYFDLTVFYHSNSIKTIVLFNGSCMRFLLNS